MGHLKFQKCPQENEKRIFNINVLISIYMTFGLVGK